MPLIRQFLDANIRLSYAFDKLLPARFRVDGNADFKTTLVNKYLKNGAVVYDVGGGKNPFLSKVRKEALNTYIVGVDICASELKAAPEGIYNELVSEDICRYNGRGDADLVICQAVLEHVADVDAAISSISRCLKPGGRACIFVPSRNALFARLNLFLPEKLKKAALYSIFPNTKINQGFKSHYDRCTPSNFKKIANSNGLAVEEARFYYISSYFYFAFPLYLAWRLWLSLYFLLRGEEAAETFSLVLKKA